jgi:hypothetical protein
MRDKFLSDFVYDIQSGSNFTNVNSLTALATSLSFVANPGDTWICEAHLTAQSSNNRGLRYAISSSGGATFGDIEGQLISNTSALTAFTSARITAPNTIIATSVHTQANTPGADQIYFSVINPSATTTISIAVAMTNAADTGTVFAGSYLIARKVR